MYVSRFIVDPVYYRSCLLSILFITDPMQDWIVGLDL